MPLFDETLRHDIELDSGVFGWIASGPAGVDGIDIVSSCGRRYASRNNQIASAKSFEHEAKTVTVG